MTIIRSFPPIVSGKDRVLILGSMPGVASLEANQYYAHPRNAFWPIMGELFGAGLELPYKQRIRILNEAGVALWETLQACVRPGSLDASITDEVPNDFVKFFKKHPAITHVFFNGAHADQAFRRHVAPTLPDRGQVFVRLPSTSPAHAGMNFKKKLEVWRCVTNI